MKATTQIKLDIARKVRELRHSRSWTQAELSKQLGISQNWLSEIERGDGSFTAEQFLVLLRLFNVSTNHFTEPLPSAVDLQNSLARLGAFHLQESSRGVPSAQLDDAQNAILEALVDATPRVITAVAPVLIRNTRRINLWKVLAGLSALGLERRLPWLIDNTKAAIEMIKARKPARALSSNYRKAELPLELFLSKAQDLPTTGALDVLDQTISTLKTVEELQLKGSDASRRWGIVTAIQPADFVDALEAADEQH